MPVHQNHSVLRSLAPNISGLRLQCIQAPALITGRMKVSHTCLPSSGKSAFETLNSSQKQKLTVSQCLLNFRFPRRR